MKQKVIIYREKEQFNKDLLILKKELSGMEYAGLFFSIYSPVVDQLIIGEVVGLLKSIFPKEPHIGNSSSGNIVDCETVNDIIVTANIFELPTSRFQIFQYDFSSFTPSEIAKEILKEAASLTWVKGIEIYWTITDFTTGELCDELYHLNPQIHVFGGIVCSPDISSDDSCIFSSVGGYSTMGVQIIFYGGDDFHVEAIKISGWKPIGRNFLVTKASGNRLYELGGVPAYEVYKKYLNIENDDNFFYNALDFPMMYEHNNTTIVRAPSQSNEDGSLNLSSDVSVGEILRLSYGDPQTILDKIYEESYKIRMYEPDVMHIFSCAARKAYWAPNEPTYEINSLKGICSVTGFFSHGEFIREKGHLNQHNITLVIASMREGEKRKTGISVGQVAQRLHSGRLPLAARMATFIRETSFELEEINSTLEVMNQHLAGLASTDTLTGLMNRLSYNEMLQNIQKTNGQGDWDMLMLDVNGLKYTNDTFGHLAGDDLIITAAKVLQKVFGKEGHCFRIGGDEFSVLIDASPEIMREKMNALREEIRISNGNNLYHLSLAIGESRLIDMNGNQKSVSDWKLDADLNMYRDKTLIHRRAYENPEMQNHKELINCMITIEEAKDSYTAHHSERVCEVSTYIAKLLGLTDNTLQMIRDAAHLHDIGKVGIRDSILFKPGALTKQEFEIIKEHPVIGARILMQSNYTQELVQIVLHHHERYDGNGYPDQLSGTEIPIGARIIALADSIDAMTSRRVYRDAMPLQICYAEIEKNIGKMYDPAIAKICLDHWEELVQLLT